MKLSKLALKAAMLFGDNHAINCCHALSKVSHYSLLAKRFQREFAERVFINADRIVDDMSASELHEFRVFLLLFFAEWLKDGGE